MAKAPASKPKGKHPGGRPKGSHWQPTKEERLLIELAVAAGYTQGQIATQLGKSVDSLQRHCRSELDSGAFRANVKVSGALFTKAMKGDTTAMIWWEKTRRGLKDLSRTEHTGKDGGPIEYASLSEEEIDARIAAIVAGDGSEITKH
jgi:hypothetical protein